MRLVWLGDRDLNNLHKLFKSAVLSGDELGAASMYTCLYDLFSVSKRYSEHRSKHQIRWKRLAEKLGNMLTDIEKESATYPVTMQHALAAKIILTHELRKKH